MILLPHLLFYFFATLMLVCAVCAVSMRRTIHCVFSLILCFVNAAGLFLLAGSDFLALVLVVVYVGAVTILFLFVVMTIGEDTPPKKKKIGYSVFGCLLGGLLALELFIAISSYQDLVFPRLLIYIIPRPQIEEIGLNLYTTYFFPFQIAGLILLSAIVGTVTLTQGRSRSKKRQQRQDQVERTDTIKLVNAPLRKGL